jgi:hypothetical protein
MDNLNFSTEELILFSVNFLFILILVIMNLINRSKIKKLKNRYNKFMNGLSSRNLEQLLDTYFDKVNDISTKNKEIENHLNNIDRNLIQCIQKVGIVRYNAFDNVGSDLSFSIAVLDYNENGLVISGIYSRDSSSTYAKPITDGKSKYTLSVEEMQAIDMAKKNSTERKYSEK